MPKYRLQCRHADWEIRQFCKLPEDVQGLRRAAMSQLNLSGQACHRILQLALTGELVIPMSRGERGACGRTQQRVNMKIKRRNAGSCRLHYAVSIQLYLVEDLLGFVFDGLFFHREHRFFFTGLAIEHLHR
jgi:hypothetical protein